MMSNYEVAAMASFASMWIRGAKRVSQYESASPRPTSARRTEWTSGLDGVTPSPNFNKGTNAFKPGEVNKSRLICSASLSRLCRRLLRKRSSRSNWLQHRTCPVSQATSTTLQWTSRKIACSSRPKNIKLSRSLTDGDDETGTVRQITGKDYKSSARSSFSRTGTLAYSIPSTNTITSVKLIRGRYTGQLRGFTFVEMSSSADTASAIHA
jgi:hypothetical protein